MNFGTISSIHYHRCGPTLSICANVPQHACTIGMHISIIFLMRYILPFKITGGQQLWQCYQMIVPYRQAHWIPVGATKTLCMLTCFDYDL